MVTSQKGINLIKSFEGCRLKAYLCPAGVWTIGYGHTRNVRTSTIHSGLTISKKKTNALLKTDIATNKKRVAKYVNIYHWTQNEFDALVSFAFNIGSIDQLTGKGTRSKAIISQKIVLYNRAGGEVSNGLVRRRQAEQKMFLNKEVCVYVFRYILFNWFCSKCDVGYMCYTFFNC